MKEIPVNASQGYTVAIGKGVLAHLAATVRSVTKAEAVCIVSDSTVYPLYGGAICKAFSEAGFLVGQFVFPAGEASKNSETYLKLLHFLASNQYSRADCVIALGGGVVGDLAGFAAATYLRGVPYMQVPTSLLAMVDASVGGKTAIDLPAGKNLCGAFYQPSAVLCDTDTLSTLPPDIFREGCAEIIKYAILFDPELFAELERRGPDFDREAVIARCIEWKRDVVAQDEFDRGCRQLLNLGHTVGHAIEKCSHYAVSHGAAVAIGTAMAARASKCPECGRIVALLTQFGLPTTTAYSVEELYEAAVSDKKRSGSTINLIIPRAIGDCSVAVTPIEDLKTFIKEGM